MRNYNFNELLSYIDFEFLSRDLIQRELGFSFESFKSGIDGGIDFRFSSDLNDNEIIIQCKNLKNDFNYLYSKLEEELKKVKKLNPKRYIITTNVGLNPSNKKKIKELFSPYLVNHNDIYGNEDLNNLLTKKENNDIEKKYYKLWLPNINILEHLLNKNIQCQSENLLEEIEDKSKYFVYNSTYENALNVLKTYNYCIISGNPGVGKTTLAQMILLHYLTEYSDFEIYEVRTTNQINDVWNKGKKQIFLFDDFLGKNFKVAKLDKNEDEHIVRLIKRISRFDNKMVVFTTREYILNQVKSSYEAISNHSFNLTKVIIDVGKYTNKIKADILYNHIFFSSLSSKYKEELLLDYRYLDIIYHSNYNPRIIEHLTDKQIFEDKIDISEKSYYGYFIENLENPEKIWEDIFINNKISIEAKIVVYSLFIENADNFLIFGNFRFLPSIKKIFLKLYNFYIDKGLCFRKEFAFELALKELENSFIKLSEDQQIEFYDPSINDFLFNFLKKKTDVFLNIIIGLDLFIHRPISIVLKNLFDLEKNDERKIEFLDIYQKEFISQVTNTDRLNFDDIQFFQNLLDLGYFKNDDSIKLLINKYANDINIYGTKNTLDEFMNSDEFYDEKYFVTDIYSYYNMSKKYGIKKYSEQNLYDYCIETLFISHIEDLYLFNEICLLPNIKRNKKREIEELNSTISNKIVEIYEYDELDKLEECIYDLQEVFRIKSFKRKINKIIKQIDNYQSIINKNKKEESFEDIEVSDKEIISIFNTIEI